MGYTIDIDTGGTFTDGFFVSGERVEPVKVPTSPHDLTICFLECIKAGAERFGLSVEDLLYETDIIRFSNTIGTNTIINRDGSRLGLLVTAGREGLAPTRDRTENRLWWTPGWWNSLKRKRLPPERCCRPRMKKRYGGGPTPHRSRRPLSGGGLILLRCQSSK